MQELARDVYLLPGKPKHVINIYLVDNVLVDAGTPASAKRIFRGMGNGAPSSHLVTHAHPDHFGSSAEVCKHYDIPLICGERDAGNIETGRPETSDTALGRNFLSSSPRCRATRWQRASGRGTGSGPSRCSTFPDTPGATSLYGGRRTVPS